LKIEYGNGDEAFFCMKNGDIRSHAPFLEGWLRTFVIGNGTRVHRLDKP
jgi:hypothetical protein